MFLLKFYQAIKGTKESIVKPLKNCGIERERPLFSLGMMADMTTRSKMEEKP